jgi:clan AA aspartic protease
VTGRVATHQALVDVGLRLSADQTVRIECVVDTGFVGYLALPPAVVEALDLPFIRRTPANLADDSTVVLEAHVATVVWRGEELETEALATGRHPLLGTLMLDGPELRACFEEGGRVSIEDL